MKIRTTTTRDYVPGHGINFALRELFANALDARIERGAEMRIRETPDPGNSQLRTLRVTSVGVGTLPRRVLAEGFSTKRQDDRLIGTHGEGMKLALMILAREGLSARVLNGSGETWTGAFERDEQLGLEVFVWNVQAVKRQTEDFTVEVRGLEPGVIEEAKSAFRALRTHGDHAVTVPSGALLTHADECGRVYVKGLLVPVGIKLRWGFDLSKIETGRDRRSPSESVVREAALRILVEAQPSLRSIGSTLLASYEAGETPFYSWDGIDSLQTLVADLWRGKHPEIEAYARTTAESEMLSARSIRHELVPSGLYDILVHAWPQGNPERVVARRDRDDARVLRTEDLSETERGRFRWLCGLAERVGLDPSKICVGELSRDLRGMYRDGMVILARGEFENPGACLGTAAHEYAHVPGFLDGTRAHRDAADALLERMLDEVACGRYPLWPSL